MGVLPRYVYEAAAERLEALLHRQRAEGAMSPWALAAKYGLTLEEVQRRMDAIHRRGLAPYWETQAVASQAFAYSGRAVGYFRAELAALMAG